MIIRKREKIKRMIVGMDEEGDCEDEREIGKREKSEGKKGIWENEKILIRKIGDLKRKIEEKGRKDEWWWIWNECKIWKRLWMKEE